MAPPAQPTSHPEPARDTPHFEISVEDGHGQLILRPRRFFGWLEVTRLDLQIPHVTFPLDITGGMAQFQRQRCPLIAATLRVDAMGLAELTARRAGQLAAAGFEEVRIEALEGALELSAQVKVRERRAELWARLSASAGGQGGRELRLRAEEAVVLGWARRPAALLAHDLLCILFGAVDAPSAGVEEAGDAPTVVGLCEVALRPLELLARVLLSPAGWRLPELDGTRLGRIAIAPERVELELASGEAAESHPPERALPVTRVEELVRHGDLAGAIACSKEALAGVTDPVVEEALTRQLLDLLCARESSLKEATLLAREALLRKPEQLYAHLTLAQAAEARGRKSEAASELAELARLAEGRGLTTLATRALIAAAHAASDEDPAQSIALYEEAARRVPRDEQVAAALGEQYARGGRWPELARFYQSQLAAEENPERRAATLLRLGELSWSRLHDREAARAQLAQAARLDPRSRRAWELSAEVAGSFGDRAAAQAALSHAAELLAESGDALAESRTLARIAILCEEQGDLPAAREHYLRALARTPGDPGVLAAFAALAEAQHDTADALDAYERLARSEQAARETRRIAHEKLLGLYIELEDLPSARRALAERSTPPDGETLSKLARLEESMGEIGQALELYARAAAGSKEPRRAEIELERARLSVLGGDLAEERAALERAFALAGDGAIGERAARQLAARAREENDPIVEARFVDALLARSPEDRDSLRLRRAQLFQLAGDAASAQRLVAELGEPARTGRAAQRLAAELLGALGDPHGRAAAMERLAEEGTLGAEDREERAALLCDASENWLAAGDVEAAHRAVLAAEVLAPAHPRVRAQVAEVAWRRRAWEEVVTLYDELVADARGEARVEERRRLAVALDRLGRPVEAQALLAQALAAEDAQGAPVELVWRGRAEAYERAGDYLRTAETLREAALDPRTGSPARTRAELFCRAAELLHRRAGSPRQALALYTEALERWPEELVILDALEGLQAELDDRVGLASTLARKLALPAATAEQRLAWLERLVELDGDEHHARLFERDPEEGARLLERHLAALSEREAPLDALGRALIDSARAHASSDAVRRRLAELLIAAAPLEEDRSRAAGWLREAADLRRTRLGDFVGAADALALALALAPDSPNPEIRRDLETLLSDLGEWPRLAALYESELARPDALDGTAREEMIERLVALYTDVIGDPIAAARWREEAQPLKPVPAQVSVAALVRTVAPAEAVAQEGGTTLDGEIAAAEEQLANAPVEEVAHRSAIRLGLAQLYRQAERLAPAQEQLTMVLAEEPESLVALEALIEVAERRGAWEEAARASEQLAQLLDEPSARARALHHAGELYLVKLAERERAAEVYLKAIDLDPDHAPTARRLVDYFWSTGDPASAVEMALSLGQEGFAAAETTAGTRARAALAAALIGDRQTPRLATALGPGGPQAVARAVKDGIVHRMAPDALAQSVQLLCAGVELPLGRVRRAIADLVGEEPGLSAVLERI